MKDEMNTWDVGKVHYLVDLEDIGTIHRIKLSSNNDRDFLWWHYTDFGLYILKSDYWLATHIPAIHGNIIPSKVML